MLNLEQSDINGLSSFAEVQINNKSDSPRDRQWKSTGANHISRESLLDLFQNRIPFIHIENFFNTPICDEVVRKFKTFAYWQSYGFEEEAKGVKKFGVAQCDYEYLDKSGYFEEAKRTTEVQRKILEKHLNPIEKVCQMITRNSSIPAFRAYDNKYNAPYYAGIFRNLDGGAKLHIDFAKRDAIDWEISSVDAQITWNIFLNDDFQGGETLVFNRPWIIQDERKRLENNYCYDEILVENTEYVKLAPRKGDLVIFNSRNYHKVLDSSADRLTVSSFLGLTKDRHIWAWS